jgi:TPR repeat protein
VVQDYKAAVKWYRRAAEQGFSDAQGRLGAMYANGQVVQQDYKEAIKWFQLAADQGLVVAQNNLNLLFKNCQIGAFPGAPQSN